LKIDAAPAEPVVIAAVELSHTEIWARRQEEVNVLLAADKAQSAALHRARRIAARRRAVPPPGQAAQGASAPGRVAASSPAGGHGRRSATPRTRAAVRPGRARGTIVAPLILPLASVPGSGGNKRAALDPAFSIVGDENQSAPNKRPRGGSNAFNTSQVSEASPLLPSTVPGVPGLPSLPISSPCSTAFGSGVPLSVGVLGSQRRADEKPDAAVSPNVARGSLGLPSVESRGTVPVLHLSLSESPSLLSAPSAHVGLGATSYEPDDFLSRPSTKI